MGEAGPCDLGARWMEMEMELELESGAPEGSVRARRGRLLGKDQGGAGPAVLTRLSPTGGAAAFCLLWGRGAAPFLLPPQ
jgi:hypothetical protein